jgi:hypothetical protein
MTPQIVTHYADGRESDIRDMTAEEIAELQPETETTNEASIFDAEPLPSPE